VIDVAAAGTGAAKCRSIRAIRGDLRSKHAGFFVANALAIVRSAETTRFFGGTCLDIVAIWSESFPAAASVAAN
jgi:hypothetical protein